MSGIEKIYMKILVILPKFYEKTLSSAGDQNVFFTEDVHLYSSPIYGRSV